MRHTKKQKNNQATKLPKEGPDGGFINKDLQNSHHRYAQKIRGNHAQIT